MPATSQNSTFIMLSPNTCETTEEVIKAVYKDLNNAMKCPENDEKKSFICNQDVRLIWTTRRISVLFNSDRERSARDLKWIEKNIIIILSILIWIGAEQHLEECVHDHFGRNDPPTDMDLPLLRDRQLQFLHGTAHKGRFFDAQYLFFPIIIDVPIKQKTQVIPQKYRLPFETIERCVSIGGYGEVDKVTISQSYLRLKHEGDLLVPTVRLIRMTSTATNRS